MALERELDRRPCRPHRPAHIDLRRDVARPLQVVGDGPVILVAEARPWPVARRPGELRRAVMAEGIDGARTARNLPSLCARPLTRRPRSRISTHSLGAAGRPPRRTRFREQDDVRRVAGLLRCEAAAAAIQPAWRPITSSTKTLVDVRAIEATSSPASRWRPRISATEPKPGTAVRDRQIVVDRLRHVDGLQRVPHFLGQHRDLVAGVGRVAPAVVEEVDRCRAALKTSIRRSYCAGVSYFFSL